MRSKRELTRRAVVAALVIGVIVAVGLVVAISVPVLVAYVLGLGLSTFLIYGYDKLRAVRGGVRVPESALLTLVGDRRRGRRVGGHAGLAPQDPARDLLGRPGDRDRRDRRRALAGVNAPGQAPPNHRRFHVPKVPAASRRSTSASRAARSGLPCANTIA